MKKDLLVTLADINYIDQAKQLFSSAYWNAGWKGDYMLLSHEISEKDLEWFKDKDILIKKCKPLYFKQKGIWPPVIYSKFYLFTPYFKKWKNIVYLDSDIIVRASLEKLTKVNCLNVWFHNKKDFQLAGQFVAPNKKNKKTFKTLMQQCDLTKATFNSGVMAFNTNVIKENTFSSLLQLLKTYESICLIDDAILNLYFYGKAKSLHNMYNVDPKYYMHKYKIKPEEVKGIILHFMNRERPWTFEGFFQNEWKDNLMKADYIDIKKRMQLKKIPAIDTLSYQLLLEIRRWLLKIGQIIGLAGKYLRILLDKI